MLHKHYISLKTFAPVKIAFWRPDGKKPLAVYLYGLHLVIHFSFREVKDHSPVVLAWHPHS